MTEKTAYEFLNELNAATQVMRDDVKSINDTVYYLQKKINEMQLLITSVRTCLRKTNSVTESTSGYGYAALAHFLAVKNRLDLIAFVLDNGVYDTIDSGRDNVKRLIDDLPL